MQAPPHQGGQPQHHEPREADGDGEGDEREYPPLCLQPPPGDWAHSDSGSDHSLPQSKSVEFDLPSPARPKSPWGRFDPYNNNEVTREPGACVVLCLRKRCLSGVEFLFRRLKAADRLSMLCGQNLHRHGNVALLRYWLRISCAQSLDDHLRTRRLHLCFSFRTRTKNMWVSPRSRTRCTGSRSRRDSTSRSWLQVKIRLLVGAVRSCGILSQLSFLFSL